MTKYKIYHNGHYIDDSIAVSPEKAINNMRWRKNMLYTRMCEWSAVVHTDNVPAHKSINLYEYITSTTV